MKESGIPTEEKLALIEEAFELLKTLKGDQEIISIVRWECLKLVAYN